MSYTPTTDALPEGSTNRYVTTAEETKLSNLSGTNTGDETAARIGSLINGSSAAVPNDTDLVATSDTSVLKKITWTNVKAFLKTYFDTLYQAAGTYLTSANISDTAYDATSWDSVTTIAPSKNAVRDKFESVATAIDAKVSDTAYDATSWNAVTTIAPSKNAVRDKFETVASDIAAKVDDTAYDPTSWDAVTTVAPSKNAVRDKFVSVDAAKQDTLVSSTNIKTVAGTSILGSGNLGLSTAEAFCTAETTLSAVTYADITGASISLAAGTWLIMATINGASQTTTVSVMMAAITDSSNNVVAEGSQHIVAGTATVRTWGNVSLSAIVAPSGTTTYKLRGARGTTTQTGNWIASDGNGVNTANNVSNNSDKGTSIRAIRIA